MPDDREHEEFVEMLSSRLSKTEIIRLMDGSTRVQTEYECGCDVTISNPDCQEENEVDSAFICAKHEYCAAIMDKTLEFQFLRHSARTALRAFLIRQGTLDRWHSQGSIDLDPEYWDRRNELN